jgi:hypothetical protein
MTNSALDMQKTTTHITHNGFARGSVVTDILKGGTTVADRIHKLNGKDKPSRIRISPMARQSPRGSINIEDARSPVPPSPLMKDVENLKRRETAPEPDLKELEIDYVTDFSVKHTHKIDLGGELIS